MNDELITFETYKPSAIQNKAHLSPKRYKLFGGAMNCGKSFWLCAEAIRLSIMFPGNAGLIARYRYKDLKKSTLPILLQMIPRQILRSYNKTEGLIEFVNGSIIYCSDLEDPNKLKSMNLGWFAIDEATDVPTHDAFNMLTTRLRLRRNGIRYFGLLATNPEPGWVKDKWITDPTADFAFFPALPQDNPAFSQEYINDLIRNLPPSLRARYLEGSWDAFDDSIFMPEWIMPSIDNTENYANIITFVDPAIDDKKLDNKRKDPDETSICTVGIEYITGLFHEIKTVSGRWSHEQILNNCEAVYNRIRAKYTSNYIFFSETNAAQDWLRQNLIREKKIQCQGYKSTIGKIAKALSVQAFFEQRRVRINTPKLQKQLIEFPNGTHDDLADSLIMALVQFKSLNIHEPSEPDWFRIKESKRRQLISTQKVVQQIG